MEAIDSPIAEYRSAKGVTKSLLKWFNPFYVLKRLNPFSSKRAEVSKGVENLRMALMYEEKSHCLPLRVPFVESKSFNLVEIPWPWHDPERSGGMGLRKQHGHKGARLQKTRLTGR